MDNNKLLLKSAETDLRGACINIYINILLLSEQEQ